MQGIKKFILLILLGYGTTGWAQPTLNELLSTANTSAEKKEEAYARIQSIILGSLTDHSADRKVLHRVFRKIHTTFLKQYEAYSDFNGLFTEGKYDCLTATSLFSHVLSQMKFDFDVIETNYHIFIMVQTSEGEVMLETTDRLGGFVTDPQVIAKRTKDYRNNFPTPRNGDQVVYNYSCKLYQTVPTENLPGLLMYNQAVKAYNRGEWLNCALALEKAHASYATARCGELGDILIRTIMVREVPEPIKIACLTHLKPLLMAKAGAVAAN